MSRNDLAELCVRLLESPGASNTTFEVKATTQMTEVWKPETGAAPRDWDALFASAKLLPGVTGKTIGGKYTGKTPEVEALQAVA